MFKKIEAWILYLTIFLSIFGAIAFGTLVRIELGSSTKLGWLSSTALFLSEIPLKARQFFNTYGGELRYGLVMIDKNLDQPAGFSGSEMDEESYLLLARYDLENRKHVIELVDLRSFKIKHTWMLSLQDTLLSKSNKPIDIAAIESGANFTPIHPFLTNDGSIIYGSHSLKKIDKNSDRVWENIERRFHHSLERDSNNFFWIPSSLNTPSIDPRLYKVDEYCRGFGRIGGFCEDSILKFDHTGKIIFDRSLVEIFKSNGMERYFLNSLNEFNNDPFHLNDIQPVLTNGPFWKQGDLFLSIRNLSIVMLYRPSTNEVIWYKAGPWLNQHDVDIISDSEISVFNNNTLKTSEQNLIAENNVIIYDFSTDTFKKFLQEGMERENINTPQQGLHEILKNKGMLVEDTINGRIIFFDDKGETLWRYKNSKDGKVGVLFWSRLITNKEEIFFINQNF